MTREELKKHCEKQIENCERWASYKGEKPCGKVYEEHKLILELLEQESILDGIKADIEKLDGMYVLRDHVFYAEKDPKSIGLWYIRLKEVIDVIDKYKESEDEK